MQIEWVYEPVISYYEMLLFRNAIKNHSNYFYYIPIAIARREEAGRRYRFLCIAKAVASGLSTHFSDIEVYKPHFGKPYATCVNNIAFDCMSNHRMPLL